MAKLKLKILHGMFSVLGVENAQTKIGGFCQTPVTS